VITAVGGCQTLTSWTQTLQQTTALLAYKRIATVGYSRADLSITSIQDISDPASSELVHYNPEDFRYIFRTLLSPGTTLKDDDNIMIKATLITTGWALRLYSEVFSSDLGSPLELLQNFISLPIHFAATAWELANATTERSNASSSAYTLPDEMVTTASGADQSERLRPARWAINIFTGLASTLVLYATALLGWTLHSV